MGRFVQRTQPFVIGITGSIGKTSCRMVLAHILEQSVRDLRVVTSPKNFNGEL